VKVRDRAVTIPSDRSAGIRRHRGLDVVLLVLTAVVVGAVTASVAVAFGGERMVQLWAAATIADDGSARITEVIDWDFGPHQQHGIVRDVPGLRTSAPIEVSSPDAPDAVEVNAAGVPRIRVGNPDRTVSGLHRYVLTYTLDGVVRGGRLAWNAVGTGWGAPVENAEVHVTAPTVLDGAGCTTGLQGSRDPCTIRAVEPGHLVAAVDGLDAHEGVTVSATTGAALGATPALPAPPVAVPPLQGVTPFVPGVLAAGVALLAAALASQPILRAGRERVPTVGVPVSVTPGRRARIDLAELAGYVVPSPSLPAGLTPAQGGVLLAGHVLDRHKAAWLIDQAVTGVVDLVPDNTPAKELTLVRLQPGDRATARLLDIAFGGRDRLTLGTSDRDFARMWEALGRDLSAWPGSSGLWDARADRRTQWVRVLGALAGVTGVALAILGGVLSARQTGLPLVLAGLGGALAGAGAAAAVRGWELRVFTPGGSAAWLQVESLRQFLAQSAPAAVDEVIASGRIGRYTPWAVALGEAERWSELASTMSVPAPYTDTRGLLYAGYAPMFVAHCRTSSMASSGSSGGGGGVGGGAGGGGGGSW
jgi:Predicted membrane protein (DUF2207) C-terminal domain/Predicted membrane protein (DUF2207) N-terminal domain